MRPAVFSGPRLCQIYFAYIASLPSQILSFPMMITTTKLSNPCILTTCQVRLPLFRCNQVVLICAHLRLVDEDYLCILHLSFYSLIAGRCGQLLSLGEAPVMCLVDNKENSSNSHLSAIFRAHRLSSYMKFECIDADPPAHAPHPISGHVTDESPAHRGREGGVAHNVNSPITSIIIN